MYRNPDDMARPDPYQMAHRMTRQEYRPHLCDNPDCSAWTDDLHVPLVTLCRYCGLPLAGHANGPDRLWH